MTRSDALRKLTRLYGKRAYSRVLPQQTSPERRSYAMDELRELRAKRAEVKARMEAWLRSQADYQQMLQDLAALSRLCREVEQSGDGGAYKFTIGRSVGWANEVTGCGDTWEEAFAAAERREMERKA